MPAPNTLTDEITLQPNGQGSSQTVKVRANPEREYISGTPYLQMAYPRVLPYWIDPVSADFGIEIYDEKMPQDPIVDSSLNALKLSALAQAPRLVSVDDKDSKANAIRDFCQSLIDSVDFYSISWQMLDCLKVGHKITEITYRNDSGKDVWDRLAVKPNRAVVPVVDGFMRHIGYRYMTPGLSMPLVTGMWEMDLKKDPNFLGRSKCAIITNRPVDGSPQGTSQLKSAYNAWFIRNQSWPLLLKFLAVYSLPILIGVTAEGAFEKPVSDPVTGLAKVDTHGNLITLTPEQALSAILSAIQQGSPVSIPHGADIKTISVTGDGDAIKKTIDDLCANEIRVSIVGNTLTGSTAGSGPTGSSRVHQDTQGTYTDYVKTILEMTWRNELLATAVGENYGEQVRRFTPHISLSEAEKQDIPAMWNAAHAIGYSVTPEQMPELDAQIGAPPRPANWQELAQQRSADALKQQQETAAQQGPEAPPANGEPEQLKEAA